MFRRNVSRKFILRASGYPDIPATEVGSWTVANFTAFKIKPRDMNLMVDHVKYRLLPESSQGAFRWETGADLIFIKPSITASLSSAQLRQRQDYFDKVATVLQAKMTVATETGCPSGKICIVLGLAEAINLADLSPITQFCEEVPMTFAIQAAGSPEIPLSFYGITAVNQGRNVGFVFSLDPSTMLSGVLYKIFYKGSPNLGPYKWIFPADLTISK
jgi:hypothetical protein